MRFTHILAVFGVLGVASAATPMEIPQDNNCHPTDQPPFDFKHTLKIIAAPRPSWSPCQRFALPEKETCIVVKPDWLAAQAQRIYMPTGYYTCTFFREGNCDSKDGFKLIPGQMWFELPPHIKGNLGAFLCSSGATDWTPK